MYTLLLVVLLLFFPALFLNVGSIFEVIIALLSVLRFPREGFLFLFHAVGGALHADLVDGLHAAAEAAG